MMNNLVVKQQKESQEKQMDVLDKELQLEKIQYDIQKDKEEQLYRQ